MPGSPRLPIAGVVIGGRVLGIDLAFREDAETPSPLSERIVCDITDEASLRSCLDALADAEPVRGLVNCAGFHPVESFAESDSSSWRRQVDVNLLAPVIACQTVLPRMIDSGWGRIVNITSDSSRTGAARLAVYAGTVRLLVSEAADYITGEVLSVGGGLTMVG